MQKSTLPALKSILNNVHKVCAEPNTDYGLLRRTLEEYKNLLLDLSGLDPERLESKRDVQTDSGKAIGTTWAAMCLDDLIRTKQFVAGVAAAVQQQIHNTDSNTPIHILYAGTGPFASLLLPLTAAFTSSQIQCTLLEIHPLSYEILRNIITSLELEEYVAEISCCDAATYRIPNDRKIDIILTETMQHALKSEPQVAITRNLLAQTDEHCLLVPQRIALHVAVLNPSVRHQQMMGEGTDQPSYISVGTFFELSKESFLRERETHPDRELPFRSSTQQFPLPQNHIIAGYTDISVLTTIEVFGNIVVDINQSGLTIPLKLEEIRTTAMVPSAIDIYYVSDENPRAEWMLVR